MLNVKMCRVIVKTTKQVRGPDAKTDGLCFIPRKYLLLEGGLYTHTHTHIHTHTHLPQFYTQNKQIKIQYIFLKKKLCFKVKSK